MGKSRQDPRIQKHEKLALEAPRFTIVSDEPLLAEESHRDSFDLTYQLGPVYDILRNPRTRTPMAIAVYGSWGTGKTTAMRWLHGLLLKWNEKGTDKERIRLRPVWFYPWKYHDKEDVWRGLIAEVIIASIDVREAISLDLEAV